ncbi:RES family NAD+ phosphorylase [Nakamurella endophytica]|uniref:RES domain-containing protein n=1 Tax=Nakamurella endophytica TaxID=1748367 RepID=A0A917T5J0_9ACTN|nr:RES family NAD+ phosphorylase [Nakamurella endophytica]GGM10005.1 hypothetical protein GCM10011594_32420 [Nakamurella endophytica]
MPLAQRHTADGPVAVLNHPGTVWRVGYLPDPWNWTPWEYAEQGRFHGRWDDPDGRYRTLYAGVSLLGCLVEVLACFRPDPTMDLQLADIQEDPQDAQLWPTAPAGQVPLDWLTPRTATSATLTGTYCSVTKAETISTLRPRFLAAAITYGLPDFDAAALRLARPRSLTQEVSAWLYRQHLPTGDALFDGAHFQSRHGDDHELLAIFERGVDDDSSRLLTQHAEEPLHPAHPAIVRAMALHRLVWAG